jgi:Arc/MetJ family transcription regulator
MMHYLMIWTGGAMRTTVTLDDDLVSRAQELTGRSEVSAIVRLSVELLVRVETGRRLALLGGSDPSAAAGRRTRDQSS